MYNCKEVLPTSLLASVLCIYDNITFEMKEKSVEMTFEMSEKVLEQAFVA